MKLVSLFCLAALVTLPSQLMWSQSDCDPSLKSDNESPQGYHQRGDRCEGLYWRPYAMETSLSVVGFHRAVHLDSSTLPGSVHLAWKRSAGIPPNAQVSVRSVLLRSDMYYRMDAHKSYSVATLDWQTDVLRALHLDFKDLGLFAYTSAKIGGAMWQVYLPLDIGTPREGPSTYEVTLVPGTALADLSWQCSKLGSDGLPSQRVNGDKLKRSFPAAEPIRLQLPIPPNEGYFYVEIDANALSPHVVEPLHADFAFFSSR